MNASHASHASDAGGDGAGRSRRPRPMWAAAAVALGLLAVVWFGLDRRPSLPGDGSDAAGFARDMAAHHQQAVTMAEIIRDRTDDAQLRLLATDIALTQQSQIGRMRGWLDVWGLPATGRRPRMAWMGEPMSGPIPGMASAADLERLRARPVTDAENLFLRLMIDHHRAGVAMAEAAIRADVPAEVMTLARGIVVSQRSEIGVLQGILAARGQPVPEDPATSHEGMGGG